MEPTSRATRPAVPTIERAISRVGRRRTDGPTRTPPTCIGKACQKTYHTVRSEREPRAAAAQSSGGAESLEELPIPDPVRGPRPVCENPLTRVSAEPPPQRLVVDERPERLLERTCVTRCEDGTRLARHEHLPKCGQVARDHRDLEGHRLVRL